MHFTRLLVASGAVLTLAPQPAFESRIDAAVARIQPQVPGLSIAVAVDGRIAYGKGAGTTSLMAAAPPTADTQYRIASVSKAVTAVAVFKLVEDGAVDLDRPARDYCPALAALNGTPTVRHFLLHQSGMRHTTDGEDESIRGPVPRLATALDRVARERLRFEPGSRTLYTSWGYAALGCVIEGVSGRGYGEFVTDRVLAPAGMTRTTFDHPDYAGADFSPGFRMRGRAFAPALVVDTRFKTPASGIISTANDLARFGLALVDHRLLPERLWQAMLATPRSAGDEPAFTAGWATAPSTLGTPVFSSNGSMEGTTAVLVVLPERRVVVSVVTNRERYVAEMMPLVRETLRAALGLPPEQAVNRLAETRVRTAVADAILLKPLPYPEPERLVAIDGAPFSFSPQSGMSLSPYVEQSALFAGAGTFVPGAVSVRGDPHGVGSRRTVTSKSAA